MVKGMSQKISLYDVDFSFNHIARRAYDFQRSGPIVRGKNCSSASLIVLALRPVLSGEHSYKHLHIRVIISRGKSKKGSSWNDDVKCDTHSEWAILQEMIC